MTNPHPPGQYGQQPGVYGQSAQPPYGSQPQPSQYPQHGQPQYGQQQPSHYGQSDQYGQPGQYEQQQGSYGQQPPHGQGDGQTAIALTAKHHWAFFMLAFFKPKVFLNGQEVAAAWGRQVWTISPGQHQLHVHVPYLIPSQIGKADITVPVDPGQTVEVEYKAPLWVFSGGALGPPPQKYPAAGITIGLLIALVVIMCACCCIGVIGSASA